MVMNRNMLVYAGILAALFVSVVLFPSPAHSALYKWVDKNGQVHITDYHPGSDEMQGTEEEAVPDKPPQQPKPETKETKQQPVEEKREAPLTQQLPQQDVQQKPRPAPDATPAAPPAPATPQAVPQLPKDFPAFPGGNVPQISPNMMMKIITMMGAFSIIIGLVFYLFFAACLYAIAKKLGVSAPWLAWIPIVQIWTFVVAARGTDGQPVLWLVGLIVPIIGAFIGIYLWMCITENMGKNKWLGLLTLLPVVNLIFMAWLATLKVPSAASPGMMQPE
jgi:hypothetical protein